MLRLWRAAKRDDLARMKLRSIFLTSVSLGSLALGCENPNPTPTDAAVPPSDAVQSDAGPPVDAFSTTDAARPACEGEATDFPGATDYACPTVRAALTAMPNAFPYVLEPPGASARAVAFEQMRTNGFFDYASDPEPADFTTTQDLYLGGGEGIASRTERRFDPHFPLPSTAPADMLRICQDETIWRANPQFCIGPSTLNPIILQALQQGQLGDTSEPQRFRAARIEAAILWFLHVSAYKEATTCITVFPGGDGGTDDCDSAWGYYTGGADRTTGIGYASLVHELEPATHDAIWEGLLAIRCWREMDPSDPAMVDWSDISTPQLAFFERAHAQEDRALDRGMVVVLMDRLHRLHTTSGMEQAANLEFLRTILGPHEAITLTDTMGMSTTYPAGPSLFDRTLRAVSATDADFVATEIAKPVADIDVDAIIARLDAAFPCP